MYDTKSAIISSFHSTAHHSAAQRPTLRRTSITHFMMRTEECAHNSQQSPHYTKLSHRVANHPKSPYTSARSSTGVTPPYIVTCNNASPDISLHNVAM